MVSEQLRQPTVILFDEIGVALTRYPELDDAFWESLRSLATNQVDGNLGFVLSSAQPPDVLAQHQGLGSPFFNIFGYTAVLGHLSEAGARALIATSPTPFANDDVEWILAESGRWPMPLQILCRERLLSLSEGEPGDRLGAKKHCFSSNPCAAWPSKKNPQINADWRRLSLLSLRLRASALCFSGIMLHE